MRFKVTPEEDARLHSGGKTRYFKCTICDEVLYTHPICHENKINGVWTRCQGTFIEVIK